MAPESYESKCRRAAEACYILYVGINNEKVAESAFGLAQHFAACAVIPDFLGGPDEMEPLVDRFLETMAAKIKEIP